MSVCAFCGESSTLCKSHLIPSFVFKWKKATGGTPYLRFSGTPNRRAQDGLKVDLLCHSCEASFSKYEKLFAEKIFKPFTNDQVSTVRYSDWLLHFCCSVSWRLLTYFLAEASENTSNKAQMSAAQSAAEKWKGFITGDHDHPDKYEQHLIFFPSVGETDIPELPNNINRYLARTIEFDFIYSEDFFSTFCKMGPFILFGFIQPYPGKWRGTRISKNHGIFPQASNVLPIELKDYLFERAAKHKKLTDSLSKEQQSKIEETVLSNPDRFTNSGQFKAMMMDAELFGIDSIVSKKRA